MRETQAETGHRDDAVPGSWTQLLLELGVGIGVAALLCLTAERLPSQRPDANALLAIAVILHAAGLLRLAARAADFAGRERTH